MNEEKWVLAMLIRRLLYEEARKEGGYKPVYYADDICKIIEELRAEAVLGEPEDYGKEATA